MTYTLQKDVALVTVCDEHFLVAAGRRPAARSLP